MTPKAKTEAFVGHGSITVTVLSGKERKTNKNIKKNVAYRKKSPLPKSALESLFRKSDCFSSPKSSTKIS